MPFSGIRHAGQFRPVYNGDRPIAALDAVTIYLESFLFNYEFANEINCSRLTLSLDGEGPSAREL